MHPGVSRRPRHRGNPLMATPLRSVSHAPEVAFRADDHWQEQRERESCWMCLELIVPCRVTVS